MDRGTSSLPCCVRAVTSREEVSEVLSPPLKKSQRILRFMKAKKGGGRNPSTYLCFWGDTDGKHFPLWLRSKKEKTAF